MAKDRFATERCPHERVVFVVEGSDPQVLDDLPQGQVRQGSPGRSVTRAAREDERQRGGNQEDPELCSERCTITRIHDATPAEGGEDQPAWRSWNGSGARGFGDVVAR